MKVKFNKIAQEFFYISNLSMWDFSCIKEYNLLWGEITEQLSDSERSQLNIFKDVIVRYGFDDNTQYLGQCFYNCEESEIWDCVSKMIKKEEYSKVRSVFEVLKPKFELLWREDQTRLISMAKTVEIALANEHNLKNVMVLFERLFAKIPGEFTIHLIAIPVKSKAMNGSANTDSNVVTLEIRTKEDAIDGVYVALHELAHYIIRSDKRFNYESYPEQYRSKFSDLPIFNEQGFESALEECVLLTLIPDGALNKGFRKQQLSVIIRDRHDLENYLIYQSRSLANSCIVNKKKIDQEYMDRVLRLLEKIVVQ